MKLLSVFLWTVVIAGMAYAKVCPECGTENNELAKFCKSGCGFEFGRQSDPGYILERAEAAFQRGRWESAKRLYEHLLKLDPGNSLAQSRKQECIRRQQEEERRRQQEAQEAAERAAYERWVGVERSKRGYYVTTARGLASQGQWVDAARYALSALVGNWDDSDAIAVLREAILKGSPRECCNFEGVFDTVAVAERYRKQLVLKATEVCQRIGTGFLRVEVSEADAEVFVDGEKVGVSPVPVLRQWLGLRKLQVRKKQFHEEEQLVRIAVGETTVVRVDLKSKMGYVCLQSKPSGAKVMVDGWERGVTPLCPLALEGGKYSVRMTRRRSEPWEGTLDVAERDTATLMVTLKGKTRLRALRRSLLIPGRGQFYRERPVMGTVYLLACLGGAFGVLKAQIDYMEAVDAYEEARDAYEREGDWVLWHEMNHRYDVAQEKREVRRMVSMGLGVCYVLNLLDTLIF